jgi:hypothetical protein
MLSLGAYVPSITPLHPRRDQLCIPNWLQNQLQEGRLCLARSGEVFAMLRIGQKAVIRVIQLIKQNNEARNLLLKMVRVVGLGDGNIEAKRRKCR